MQCKSFIGYQLSTAGIIRLPRFEMAMAKSEANSKPVLATEDVHIVTIYGRKVDIAMLLHSHRFYRDAVVQQTGNLGRKVEESICEAVAYKWLKHTARDYGPAYTEKDAKFAKGLRTYRKDAIKKWFNWRLCYRNSEGQARN